MNIIRIFYFKIRPNDAMISFNENCLMILSLSHPNSRDAHASKREVKLLGVYPSHVILNRNFLTFGCIKHFQLSRKSIKVCRSHLK